MSAIVDRTETNDDREGFTLILAIENLDKTWEKDVESSIFVSKSLDNTEWQLVLHPIGHENDVSEECMSLRLVQIDDKEIVVDSDLSITNTGFLETNTLKNHKMKKDFGWIVHQVSKGEHIFILRKTEFIFSDTLIIRCRIWRKFFEHTDPELIFLRVKIERLSFEWPINDFCQPSDKRKMYINKCHSQTPFLIFEFFTEGIKENAEIEIILTEYAILESSYRVSILDKNGKVFKSKSASHSFGKEPDRSNPESFRFPSFIRKSEVIENKKLCLPMDVLTLQISCFFCTPNAASTNDNFGHISIKNLQQFNASGVQESEKDVLMESRIQASKLSKSTDLEKNPNSESRANLVRDMQCMYEERLFSDSKLVSEGKEFNVHKNILAYRSQVLKALFTSPLTESIIQIEGLDPSTLRRMLLFLYTDQVEDLTWESAMHLRFAAVKYAIHDLKDACCSILKSLLNTKNACDILLQSDLQKDIDLNSLAKEYIVDHLPEIIGTEEWEKLQTELTNEIFDLYIKELKG